MDQNFLKITYHSGVKKMNAYLKMPSPTYHVLKKEIEFCLFGERKQDCCEIRTYWIDEDRDEIEIRNQCDYEIFMAKRSNRLPLHVSPADMDTEEHGVYENGEKEKSTNTEKVDATTSFYPFSFNPIEAEQSVKIAKRMWFAELIKNDPNLREKFSTNTSVSSTAAASTQSTPKVSLNGSHGFYFSTLDAKDSTKNIEKEKSTNTEKVDATTSFYPASFNPIETEQSLKIAKLMWAAKMIKNDPNLRKKFF